VFRSIISADNIDGKTAALNDFRPEIERLAGIITEQRQQEMSHAQQSLKALIDNWDAPLQTMFTQMAEVHTEVESISFLCDKDLPLKLTLSRYKTDRNTAMAVNDSILEPSRGNQERALERNRTVVVGS